MKPIWKLLITLAVGLLGVAFVAWYKDILNQSQLVDIYHVLCDAFFVVGVVITGFGLLVFVNNEGAFDMMVYGVQSFVDLFRKQSQKKYVTFYDYRMSREGKKMKFGFLLIGGAVFLVVAGVMLLLYMQQG